MPTDYTEALEAALGAIVREMQTRAELMSARGEAIIAGLLQRVAESDARARALEDELRATVAARLADLKDGAPGRDVDPATVDALRADIARLSEAAAATASRVADMGRALSAIPEPAQIIALPDPPDLSGFATKEELAEEVAALLAAGPDLSGLATRAELVEIRESIPDPAGFVPADALPRAIADLTADVQAEIGAAAAQLAERVDTLAASIPEPIDPTSLVAGLATVEQLAAVSASIPAPPDLSGFATIESLMPFATAAELREVAGQIPNPEPALAELDRRITACHQLVLGETERIDSVAETATAALGGAQEARELFAALPTAPDYEALLAPHTAALRAELAEGVSVVREGLPAEIAAEVERAVAAIDREALRGPAGRLPVAEPWADRVHYAGDVRTHGGATWQAKWDTGREPGAGDDWICLAAPGAAPRGFRIRGTYNPEDDYDELDIVALNGSSFVCRRDGAGVCPGDDWQLWAKPGKPGQTIKGDPGPPGPKNDLQPVAMTVDDAGILTLEMSDGSKLAADFYPLLDKVAR